MQLLKADGGHDSRRNEDDYRSDDEINAAGASQHSPHHGEVARDGTRHFRDISMSFDSDSGL